MAAKPSLSLPTEIYFGAGRLADLPAIAGRFGKRSLLVTDTGPLEVLADRTAGRLAEAGLSVSVLACPGGEPTLAMTEAVVRRVRETGAELLIGLGGGARIDLAKAAAALATAPEPVAKYFGGPEPPGPGLPWIAVPTTAGAGAEVTPNAVLIEESTAVKQSIRASWMPARAAVVDPETTLSLPPAITASSAMDALSHAIESFTAAGANDLTDLLALEAARLIWTNLPLALADGADLASRSALARASLMAGISLANARLGLAHGLAHPIGALYGRPHGLVCAVLMPLVMRYNMTVCRSKYARLAAAWGLAPETAETALEELEELNQRLGFPAGPRELGVTARDWAFIVEQTLASGSTAANPRPVAGKDLEELMGPYL